MSRQHTRTKASLKRFLQDDEETPLPDARAQGLTEHVMVDPAVLQTLKEVFDGTDVANDREKVGRILAVRSEVHLKWSDARDSFLAVGRALLSLEAVLSRIEFQRLRSGTQRLFPFSDATATQFRQIARAVDTGRIPYEVCPGSYGTAYQITLLDDEQLSTARFRGLLRPDVTRKEIRLLRQEVRQKHHGKVDKARLQEEKRGLRRREQQLTDELATIRARLVKLDSLLFDNIP